MMSQRVRVPCLLVVMVAMVTGFPTGAMDFSCKDLKPGHGEFFANDAFHMRLSGPGVHGGDALSIRIEGIRPFKGFLIKAVNKRTGEPIGVFEAAPETETRCRNSGLTHTDGYIPKTHKNMVWYGPSDEKNMVNVEFQSSIVENHGLYTYLNSDPIMLLPATTPRPTPAPPRPTTPAPATRRPKQPDSHQSNVVGNKQTSSGSSGTMDSQDPLLTMSADARRQITQVGQITRATIRWAWQQFLRFLFPNVNFQ